MEKANPKISIIIPTYNHRHALERCLASISRQSFQDFEVIVVDDGSTDGTWEWLQRTTNKELGIRNHAFNSHNSLFLIHNSPNQGACAARNAGLAQAHGEFVIFCDADIVMRPDMLEKMIHVLDAHPHVSYVYSSFKFGIKTFRLWPFDAEKLKQIPYIHSTSLIRRAHLPPGGWDVSLKRLQDWDLFLAMLHEGHTGIWIPEILFTVEPRRKGMSVWFPSMLLKVRWFPPARRYHAAVAVIRKKHGLR